MNEEKRFPSPKIKSKFELCKDQEVRGSRALTRTQSSWFSVAATRARRGRGKGRTSSGLPQSSDRQRAESGCPREGSQTCDLLEAALLMELREFRGQHHLLEINQRALVLVSSLRRGITFISQAFTSSGFHLQICKSSLLILVPLTSQGFVNRGCDILLPMRNAKTSCSALLFS